MAFRHYQKGFSLVELMVVLTIMSIISSVTFFSLNLSVAEKLTGDGGIVSDTITMARQNSIAQDAYTAIVVQSAGQGTYETYCLMQLKRDPSTGTYASSTWQQLTAWRHLNGGVVFDPSAAANGSQNFLDSSDSITGLGASPALTYQGQPLVLTNTKFHLFSPDGTMSSSQPIRLRLVRGVVNSNVVTYQNSSGSSNVPNYFDILFLQNSGQTKILRP